MSGIEVPPFEEVWSGLYAERTRQAGEQVDAARTDVPWYFKVMLGGGLAVFFLALLLGQVLIALGAAVGTIPLGKIRLGASGALFVGLLVGAVLPDVGARLALFQSFGLALFAYLIGLGAGKVFFRDLRRNLPLMLAAVLVVILTAFTVHPLAALLHLDLPTAIGVWTGSLTATPAMALLGMRVVQLDRPDRPGVGPVWAIVRTASVFFIVPALLVDRDGRGVHDRASRTMVLRSR